MCKIDEKMKILMDNIFVNQMYKQVEYYFCTRRFKCFEMYISKFQQQMHLETILVQPEIIQLGRQDSQIIKITNNTSNHLNNFFFCLFNTEKFQFTPSSFSLSPHENKLIKVTLKIKSIKAVSKEFAYLKSASTSQRITILINNSYQSPQPKLSSGEGYQEAYTLSSRDYKDTQNAAFNKIINEKQAYIARLERQIKQASSSKKQNGRSMNNELELAEEKILILEEDKKMLIQQNLLVHQRFQQYKALCQQQFRSSEEVNQHLDAKKLQILRLHDQIRILQDQASEFLKKLSEKQSLGRDLELRVRELQSANQKITQEIKLDNERRVALLQQKLQQQKMSYQNSFRLYQGKIKQLQLLASSEVSREQHYELQRQIQRIQEVLQNQRQKNTQLSNQRRSQDQLHQSQKIKLQLLNSQLTDKNIELTRRIRQLQRQLQKAKEDLAKKKKPQMEIQKNNSILQETLQNAKNQNQILRKNLAELQRAYSINQSSASEKVNELQNQLSKKHKESENLKENIQRLYKEKQMIEQKNHQNTIKIKEQNLILLQKIANSDGNVSKKYQKQCQEKQAIIVSLKTQIEQFEKHLQQVERQNQKLQTKIYKFKSRAQNQLKSINDKTLEELKKIREEKKALAKRVVELQNSIQSSQNQKTRQKSKTGEAHVNVEPSQRNVGERKIGIKDQRKQLQESRSQSNTNFNTQNVQHLWGELGQLRQFDNYVRNEQERLGRLFGFSGYHVKEDGRSIFRSIKFFKELQNKMKQNKEKIDNQEEAIKQLAFLKGRLMQMEEIKRMNKDESINLKSGMVNGQLMQFVRAQMRTQYKKLHESLKLSEQKHNLLKKKIYQEYRSRLLNHLEKKEKNTIQQVQNTLERFIEGLSNLSHKEAVLNKQVKLKVGARKEASILRQKVQELSILLSTKKGYCSRQPMRIWVPETELDWQQNLKLQAQLLSHEAQIQRLNLQIQEYEQKRKFQQQQKEKTMEEFEDKQAQITNLKKQLYEIEKNWEKEMQKMIKENDQLKKKYANSINNDQPRQSRKIQKDNNKDRDLAEIKKELEVKKQTIKALKEKEKHLEQLLQSSNRSDLKEREKDTYQEQQRQMHLKQLKDSNRQLRKQNSELKDKNKKLEEQISKKNTYLNSLRVQSQEHRVRAVRKEQLENEKLKDQIKILKDQIKKLKQEVEKASKGKMKDFQKYVNQSQIQIKSLGSNIRALLRSIRRIYVNIQTMLKKKGKRVGDTPDFQKMENNPLQVNGLSVYQYFQQPLELLGSQ